MVNLLEKKIEKCLPLQEKANIIIFEGKHIGENGVVNEVKDKVANVKIGNRNIDILIKQILVVE